MIIDCHTHIASWPSIRTSRRNILLSMKEYNISYSLVSDCDCSEFPSLEDRYPVRQISQIQGLKECLSFAKRYPDKIGVLVWLNPHKEKLTEEFKALIEKNLKYIHGFKFHPYESRMKITNKRLIPYLEYIKKLDMPLLVHTAKDEYSSIAELGKIAKKYPSVNFIAAHYELCTDDKRQAFNILKSNPNIYVDTAWVKANDVKKILRSISINKVCFGTDNPIDGRHTLDNEMHQEYFENTAHFTKEELEHIFYKNAKILYKIPL